MNTPLVTIVIPAYNAERYIEGCVGSILHQTYENIEVVIVNDGSHDNTSEICRQLAQTDKRVKHIDQENRGEMGARLTGVQNASGDWLYFVDSDDSIQPDAIALLVEKIDKNVDMVVFEFALDGVFSNVEYAKILFGFSSWWVWGKLIRSSLFDNHVGSVPRSFKVGGDFLTQLRLLKNIRGKIVTYNIKKYNYNTNNPNSVQIVNRPDYEYEKRMLAEVEDAVSKWNFKESISDALFHFKMAYFQGFLGLGYDIDSQEEYIIHLVEESKHFKLSFKEKIAIKSLRNPSLRSMFRGEKKMKRFVRTIMSTLKP